MGRIDYVEDPDDKNVIYWTAWSEQDNPKPWKVDPKDLLYRVYRDERSKEKSEPLTEAMSRDEAYAYLHRLSKLIGGKEV